MPADPFYKSKAWLTLRRTFVGQPCSTPGCQRLMSHLDHKLSRRTHPLLALERSNLQPLCHPCHSQKTARRDGAYGNAATSRPVVARGCGPDGTPFQRNGSNVLPVGAGGFAVVRRWGG